MLSVTLCAKLLSRWKKQAHPMMATSEGFYHTLLSATLQLSTGLSDHVYLIPSSIHPQQQQTFNHYEYCGNIISYQGLKSIELIFCSRLSKEKAQEEI